jgi:hypothetical protein
MNKIRLIFYAVFAAYNLGAFIFTLTLPAQDKFQDLIPYLKWFPFFKVATFIGLLLFAADVIWAFKSNRDAKKEKDALAHELNMLKARLYDIQEGKQSPSPKANSPKV